MTHEQAVETLAAERYLLDEMSELERFRFEEHFFDCEVCAETMRLGHQLRANARSVFAPTPADARPAESATRAGDEQHRNRAVGWPVVEPNRSGDAVSPAGQQPSTAQRPGGAPAPSAEQDPAAGQNAWVGRDARTSPARTKWSVALPWAAAAVLAVGLGYKTYAPGGPETYGPDGPQLTNVRMHAPVPLRPATRGSVTTIPRLEGDEFVSLYLELNVGNPGDAITYTLTRDDGEQVSRGTGVVPAPGVPLPVPLTGRQLDPGRSYVVTVSVEGTTAPPSEYRFTVAPQ